MMATAMERRPRLRAIPCLAGSPTRRGHQSPATPKWAVRPADSRLMMMVWPEFRPDEARLRGAFMGRDEAWFLEPTLS